MNAQSKNSACKAMRLHRRLAAQLLLIASLIFAPELVAAQDFLNAAPDVVVPTGYGPVVGFQGERVQIFRGIPYAAPPIGNLRFRRATSPKSWVRPRPARMRSAACPQVLDLDDSAEDGDSNMSEDCLTVNVWTPRADTSRRPVMVFIHGGALEEGSAADSWYDGTALADRGDVVVVTVQYRLGAFGFLELGEVGGPAFAESGNMGLLDQIAALRWVQKNIGRFGGDSNNVTLFGESAGGVSIRALLALAEARDLFHRVIIESGTGAFVKKARATQIARTFMELAKVRTVAELGRISMEDVMRAQSQLFAQGYGSMPFGIVDDGVVFNRSPIQLISDDPRLSKPMLIGTNSEEMRYWSAMDAGDIDTQAEEPLRQRLLNMYGPDVRDLVSVYRSDSNGYQEAISTLLGDAIFRIPSIRLAEINAKRAPTYMYLFTYRSQTKGPTGAEYGAMHGLEVAFVFHVDSAQAYTYVGSKGSWAHLSDQMVQAWTRFARSGDPNGPLLPFWPRYDTDQRATMELGHRTDVVLDPYGAERKAWAAVPSELLDSADVGSLADPPSAQHR